MTGIVFNNVSFFIVTVLYSIFCLEKHDRFLGSTRNIIIYVLKTHDVYVRYTGPILL